MQDEPLEIPAFLRVTRDMTQARKAAWKNVPYTDARRGSKKLGSYNQPKTMTTEAKAILKDEIKRKEDIKNKRLAHLKELRNRS
jgi:hypothetical protein